MEERQLARVHYARLVRKGGADRPALSLLGGYQAATSLWSDGGLCHGGVAGSALALSRLTVDLAIGACRSRDPRQFLEATADVFDARAGLWMEWDLRAATLGVGATAGLALIHQQFATPGRAPPRWSTGAEFGAAGRVTVALGRRAFLVGQLSADTLVLRRDPEDVGASGDGKLSASAGGRALLGAGAHLW